MIIFLPINETCVLGAQKNHLVETALLSTHIHMSSDIRFPTMWYFDKRSLCSLLLGLETPNDVQSVA